MFLLCAFHFYMYSNLSLYMKLNFISLTRWSYWRWMWHTIIIRMSLWLNDWLVVAALISDTSHCFVPFGLDSWKSGRDKHKLKVTIIERSLIDVWIFLFISNIPTWRQWWSSFMLCVYMMMCPSSKERKHN